jgi:hypothetical protein
MHWFNKCDNGLIVKHEPGSKETIVISAKVREQPFAGKARPLHFSGRSGNRDVHRTTRRRAGFVRDEV